MIACSSVTVLATVLVAQSPTLATPPLVEDWEGLPAWSSPDGCTLSAVELGQAWNGRHSLHAKYSGTASCALVHPISLSSITPFIRLWLYVPAGTTARIAGTPTAVTLVEAETTSGTRIGLGLGGATVGWRPVAYVQPVVDGVPMAALAPEETEVTEGTWHLVEIGYSLGSFSIWIDDVKQPRATWPSSSYTSLDFSSIAAGTMNGIGSALLDVYIDALAMNGSQNGTFWSVALHANEVDWDGLTGTPQSGQMPGKAGGVVQVGAGTLATSTTNVKVGTRGLVATDSDTSTPGQVNAEGGSFSSSAPTLYRRFWWRPDDLAATGSRTLAAILDSNLAASPIAGIGTPLAAVDASGTALTLWGYDSTGTRVSSAEQGQAVSGWNLVELLVNGLGNGLGEGRLYLNGQPAGVVPGRDFRGRVADGYVEGQIATGANDYAGTDSFDEIRTSTQIQPSTIRLFAPETAAIGECTPIELRALTSNAVLAPIPALAGATLAGATFYLDSTCGTVPTNVILAPGLTAKRLFFVVGSDPGSGTATLSAASPDYLAIPANVVLSGTDVTAPAAPGNVGRQPAIVGASGQVRVTWDASISPDVSDYSVEMLGTSPPAPYVVSAPATVAAFKPEKPGQWLLQVVASDVLGHRSPPSGMLPLLVDWGSPRIPTFTAEPAYGTGTVTLSWPGVDDPFTALEPASGIRDFVIEQVSPDGGSSITLPADAGSYDYAVEPTGPDGVYVFRLLASDNAGNQTARDAPSVFVDRTAPAVASVGVAPIVTDAGVVVSWTASDGTGSGIASVDVTSFSFQLDAGTQTSRIFPPYTQVPFAPPEGRYTFGVVANDRAGNASPAAISEQVIVDKTPPATPHSLSAAPSPTGVDLTWSASTDALSGVERYLVYPSRDGITWDSPLEATGAAYSYAASTGTYWFRVAAVDRAANESGSSPVAMAIVPGPATKIVLEVPPPVWVGQPVDLIATVTDGQNQVTTFTGTVHFTADNGGVVPPDYTFTLADAGRHRFITGATFASGTTSLLATTVGADGSLAVAAVAPGLPQIVSTASRVAVVGQPYRYDADGAVEAFGIEPITYSASSSGSENLMIDPMTGAVLWVPPAGSAGQSFTFTVSASNSAGTTSQTFTVTVQDSAAPIAPTLLANPNPSLAPSTVTLSATVSSTLPLTYAWDFGDGSVAPAGTLSFAIHRYAFPGTYRPRVVVQDADGTEGIASKIVQIDAAAPNTPPLARISPSGTQGDAPYPVFFNCDCTPGASPLASYAWDFGDGTTSTEAAPSRTFGPGRYHVRLYVTDTAGLTARDDAIITVTEAGALPPRCRASVEPPAGPVPTLVRFTANAAPGASPISKIEWLDEVGNVTPGSSIVASFDSAGWHHRWLKVLDEAGRACWDTAVFTGYSQEGVVPPAIVSSPPSTAECGVKLEYQPVAMGTLPLAWSVASAPEGLTLDASTGKIVWTPSPAQAGPNPVELRASGSGTATQRFEVAVSCKSELDLTTGCTGCTAAGGGGPIAALLLMLLAARRRR